MVCVQEGHNVHHFGVGKYLPSQDCYQADAFGKGAMGFRVEVCRGKVFGCAKSRHTLRENRGPREREQGTLVAIICGFIRWLLFYFTVFLDFLFFSYFSWVSFLQKVLVEWLDAPKEPEAMSRRDIQLALQPGESYNTRGCLRLFVSLLACLLAFLCFFG